MPGVKAVHSIVAFLRGFLARDRYLTEAMAAVTTFALGVVASFTLDEMQTRVSLTGFREMPYPEVLVLLFGAPGAYFALKTWVCGDRAEGRASFAVMGSFLLLAAMSLATDLTNWGFWTLFCLLLGVMKGYALIREWPRLRWSVTVLGAMFWINFTVSIIQYLPNGLKILAVAPAGFAAANLLSVSRLAGGRVHAP